MTDEARTATGVVAGEQVAGNTRAPASNSVGATGSGGSATAASTAPSGGGGSGPTGGGAAGGEAAGGGGGGFDFPNGNTQGITDSEIRVGLSGPLSGVVGFLGDEVIGAIDSYFQSVNAAGGVNGRRLRLISYDDRFDNSQTLANVRRLWEQDKVHAIFLATGIGVLDYATANRIPLFVFGVTPESFASQYDTTFPIVGNALIWTQEVVQGLKDQGVFREGMRVGMLYDTQVFDVSPYLSYLVEAWELAGADVVSTDPFNLTDGDCTSLVLKMRDLKIDYWDFQGLGWILCASAASRQQYRPPVGWGNWPTSVAGLASQVGPWVDGIWGGAQGDQPTGAPRQKGPAHDEYVNAITQYHPNVASFGHFESPATIGYWTGAKLLVAGLLAQTSPTIEGTLAAITSFENFDPGITPPIISLRPDCKTGSEIVWIAQWHWDPNAREATRTPASGYFTSPLKDRYGGKCFLTILSDQIHGG